MAALALMFTAATAAAAGGPPADPASWAASPGHFCHAVTPAARIINIKEATHAQCAAACAKVSCGCFASTQATPTTTSIKGVSKRLSGS